MVDASAAVIGLAWICCAAVGLGGPQRAAGQSGPGTAAGTMVDTSDAAARTPAQDLAAARAATDRRDYAAALPLFERLVQRAPADADLLIEAARVFGWADRNARSAELYRQALAAAPARRADIVPSLAWQTLWSADATAALPLFEEAAALHPGDRPLGWALGHALNAAGRHRAAIAAFRRWAPPATDAERLDLARAWRWAGYEDRAWPLLQPATAAESVWLRDFRVARDVAPYAFSSLELTEDRDTLRTRGFTLGAGLQPAAHAVVELGGRRLDLDDDFGAAAATTFEASGRLRLGEPDSRGGTWWPQLVLRAHRIGAWHPFTSMVRLKWVPADRWRIDAERARELVETPRALANRVSVDVTSLGADWRRDERLAFAGGVAHMRFDDGTARERLVARGEWALRTRPRWTVGAEWSRLARTREGAAGADARGYWNPSRYQEARLVSGITWEQRPWELQARAGLARSREVDGGGNASYGAPHLWELALGFDPSPAWRLRAAAGGSGQALGLGSSGGSGARYWRRWAQVGLHGWF
ncbi:MAG: hypothetical protein HZC37_21090 [Burkholderiales bacterium]|nr:hypothetical protein [Burkholderiales bacterium]